MSGGTGIAATGTPTLILTDIVLNPGQSENGFIGNGQLVPEPRGIVLLGVGLAGLVGYSAHRRVAGRIPHGPKPGRSVERLIPHHPRDPTARRSPFAPRPAGIRPFLVDLLTRPRKAEPTMIRSRLRESLAIGPGGTIGGRYPLPGATTMSARPFRRRLDAHSGRDPSRRPTARRLAIESLETRDLLTTFSVTNGGDNGNNLSPLAGSLRWAIVQADALAPGTASTIQFDIPGGAFQTIALRSALPPITRPATIDGTTQPGYTGTPLIELDGSSAGAGASGLSYTSTASGTAAVPTQLKGLQIFSFNGAGVMNSGAAYLSLTNDYVGVQRPATYYLARGNAGGGVVISGGAVYDTIASCVISANLGNGVTITGIGTQNITVSADEIGTDAGGVTILDHNGKILVNFGNGVLISGGASHNTVTTSVLSNNTGDGVELTGPGTSFNVVSADHIGTDISGMVALPNGNNGVEVTNGATPAPSAGPPPRPGM